MQGKTEIPRSSPSEYKDLIDRCTAGFSLETVAVHWRVLRRPEGASGEASTAANEQEGSRLWGEACGSKHKSRNKFSRSEGHTTTSGSTFARTAYHHTNLIPESRTETREMIATVVA